MSTDSTATSTANPATRRENTVFDIVADWGGVADDALATLGDMTIFVFKRCSGYSHAYRAAKTLLPNFYQVGVLSFACSSTHGHIYRHGVGGTKLLTISRSRFGNELGAVINMSLVANLGQC